MKKIEFSGKDDIELQSLHRLLEDKVLKDSRVIEFMKTFSYPEEKVRMFAQRFSDWLDGLDLCVGCSGLHECRQKTTGSYLELNAEPLLMSVVTPCKYKKAEIETSRHKSNYLIYDATPEMLGVDIFELIKPKEDPTYLKIYKVVVESINKEEMSGYFIYGDPGVGKTFLAIAMTNHYAKKGKKVAFLSVPSLAQKIKNAFEDPDYIDSILSTLRNVPILVMDDIGAESVTSWFRDEILFPILNARMELKKSTWFTSNESFESLKKHYMYNQRGEKEEMKAIRIMERIEALAKPLILGGKNRRRSE